MYLSLLMIDVGDNPDRPRPGRLWLRNLYHVHQRLCMAFPSEKRKSSDPDFIMPFDPKDFGCRVDSDGSGKQVHVERKDDAGFLFRIDPQRNIDPKRGSRAMIIVQSSEKPDWDYAFHNAGFFLAAPPEVKPFDPRFAKGRHFRFRLMAYPTKRDIKSGKRVSVRTDQLRQWFESKADIGGFRVERLTDLQAGYVNFRKRDNAGKRDDAGKLRSARFEGVLEVTDPDDFRRTLAKGIGPGKAFGFGLLSVTTVDLLSPEAAT